MRRSTEYDLKNLAVAILWAVILFALLFALSGCASWSDYAAEVRQVNASIAADRKAERDREQKEDDRYLQAMAGAQSDVARVAMAGFWAMARAKGGGVKEGPGYLTVTPPKDVLESVATLAGAALPVAANVAIALRQARVAERQSDNAARTAESTNAAMVSLGAVGAQQLGAVALEQARQAPAMRPNLTFTIGRDGVIGDGSFAPVTQTLTTGGDGVLGAGSIARPANPTRICTVGSFGVVNCSP